MMAMRHGACLAVCGQTSHGIPPVIGTCSYSCVVLYVDQNEGAECCNDKLGIKQARS
jgi:hypothetical protein